MTKSTITRERLEKIKSWRETYGAGSNVMLPAEEAEELARMALAAIDSEPNRNPVLPYADSYRDMAKQGVELVPIWSVITDLERNIAPLYRHAQPAPVVPDAYVRDERGRMMLNGVCEPKIGFSAGWNACRAAMLQELPKSAEESNNCRSSENVQVMQVMQDVSRCSTKSAPALDSPPKTAESRVGNSPVIPEGYVMVPKEPDLEMVKGGACAASNGMLIPGIYRAMLAAVPTSIPIISDRWVPVSELMPEDSGRYWCYVEEQNDLGKSHYQWNCSWNGDRWWVESEGGGIVTHWMPLPAAPQNDINSLIPLVSRNKQEVNHG